MMQLEWLVLLPRSMGFFCFVFRPSLWIINSVSLFSFFSFLSCACQLDVALQLVEAGLGLPFELQGLSRLAEELRFFCWVSYELELLLSFKR